MKTGSARRGGFSLIEVLVVIGIIALLTALAAGTFLRLRGSTQSQVAEKTLSSLQSAIVKRQRAVIDAAGQDVEQSRVPTQLMTFAGNDKSLAKVVWAYLRLKNEFPTTSAEATTAVALTVAGTSVPMRQPQGYFTGVTGNNPAEESAALIYAALKSTGAGGVTMEADGLDQKIGTTKSGKPCFVDPWDSPIAFVRMAYPAEANNPPYVKAGLAPGAIRDPMDPNGLLAKLSATDLTNFWTAVKANSPVNTSGTASIPTYYDNTPKTPPPATIPPDAKYNNWVPTLVSAGPNKSFGPTTTPDPNFNWPWIGTGNGEGDNVFGFRVYAGQSGN